MTHVYIYQQICFFNIFIILMFRKDYQSGWNLHLKVENLSNYYYILLSGGGGGLSPAAGPKSLNRVLAGPMITGNASLVLPL